MTAIQTPLDFDTRREVLRAPAQAHSATSVSAGESMEPRAGTLRGRVLDYIRECGATGATDEQIQIALGMNPSTQRPRRIELVRGSHIYDSGMTRPTLSGHAATVWRAHEKEDV